MSGGAGKGGLGAMLDYAVGGGLFSWKGATYANGGGMATTGSHTAGIPRQGSGGDSPWALGAYVGVGISGMLTNATNASQLRGSFDTYAFNSSNIWKLLI
jgi:hypothetical protein